MTSHQQLDRVQEIGFGHLGHYKDTGDPAALLAAADAWRWVERSTSDPGQRSFVLAAISVAMRNYYDETEELWALQDAINAARAAVETEREPRRWVMACVYLGTADFIYFKATNEQWYLDDATAVLRAAARSADATNLGTVLSHLGQAFRIAYDSTKNDRFLIEAVEVGRQAAQLEGPMQIDCIVDLMQNLWKLHSLHGNLDVLREGEALGRWAQGTDDPLARGRVLFELSRILESIALRTRAPAVMADAIAAGEASMQLTKDKAQFLLRAVVVDTMRHHLHKMVPGPNPPPPQA